MNSFSLRDLLKVETRALHNETEKVVGFSPKMDRHQYERVLKKFLGFYLSFESLMNSDAPAEVKEFYSQGRQKAEWLIQDLKVHGITNEQVSTLPRAQFDGPAKPQGLGWWGALYVIEGSTLGGQVIKGWCQKTFENEVYSCRFLDSYGSQVGQKWQEMLQKLESLPKDPVSQAQVLMGAQWTFAQISEWFKEASQSPN